MLAGIRKVYLRASAGTRQWNPSPRYPPGARSEPEGSIMLKAYSRAVARINSALYSGWKGALVGTAVTGLASVYDAVLKK